MSFRTELQPHVALLLDMGQALWTSAGTLGLHRIFPKDQERGKKKEDDLACGLLLDTSDTKRVGFLLRDDKHVLPFPTHFSDSDTNWVSSNSTQQPRVSADPTG